MPADKSAMKILARFEIPSQPGNERLAIRQVLSAVEKLPLSKDKLDRLGTAVAETTMNAIEYGNQNDPALPVLIQVARSRKNLVVRITDHGGGKMIFEYVEPDLDAKLAGLQKPRGWGLFLIQNMVDDLKITSRGRRRTFELIMNLDGADDPAG